MILQVLAPLVRIDRQSARNAGQKGGGEQPLNALEFDRLVQKYQSLVYTICRQLVADEGYAQDLTQETFLSAWRSMDRCPAGYEKQWLARIASNKAKDYLRSAWARRVNTPGDDVPVSYTHLDVYKRQAVDHLRGLCAEVQYHLAHHVRLLHPERQPREVRQRLHLFALSLIHIWLLATSGKALDL